jgi:hypothetical protein
MTVSFARAFLAALIVGVTWPHWLEAQAETYTARLATVPVDAATQAGISGSGRVTSSLKGNTLSVSGTFTGLQSPATTANVHIGPKGLRGPAAFELLVTKATSGTIRGELRLTAAQLEHLKQSRFYVLLQSEKAPDGNLWGWLLP